MKEITSNGIAISYNTYGQGKVTLLFIHGSFINQSYWADQVAFFEQKYTVVTMDLGGHGQSGTARAHWSITGMAEDVVNLIQTLQLRNVILIGHSLGAEIALIAATNHPGPILGLIAVDMFKNAGTPLPEEYQAQVAGILDAAKKDYAGTNEQYARMVLVTQDTPAWITDKIVAAYRDSYEPMGQQTLPEFFEMDSVERERLPQLRGKLHLINVAYMPTHTAALDRHTTNGYALTEIAGTCHYPMLENPEALNAALDKAINDLV